MNNFVVKSWTDRSTGVSYFYVESLYDGFVFGESRSQESAQRLATKFDRLSNL